MKRFLSCAQLVMLSMVLLSPSGSHAVATCKVKVSSKNGAIAISATGVSGPLAWGDRTGGPYAGSFVNAATCIADGKATNCALGAAGTPEAVTPPDLCTFYLKDAGAECAAWTKGCTPGPRSLNQAKADDLKQLVAAVSFHHSSPTMRFTGVNVQIVSGSGATDGPTNGTGNLIVGYNEGYCSISLDTCSTDADCPGNVCVGPGSCLEGGAPCSTNADCTAESCGVVQAAKSGSHNLIVGDYQTYTSYGGLVAGRVNQITAPFASVSGGKFNAASEEAASVSGGESNTASGVVASISGGAFNHASNLEASVSGGVGNTASGPGASATGGGGNVASGYYSSVGGGDRNTASDWYAAASGGQQNIASGQYAAVGGGRQNRAGCTSPPCTLANGDGPFSTVSGGFQNVATGGDAAVSGGAGNTARGDSAAVSGGSTNTASGLFSSVSGGRMNRAGCASPPCLDQTGDGPHASVSGGASNVATGGDASVSGGGGRTAPGDEDWAAGGLFQNF